MTICNNPTSFSERKSFQDIHSHMEEERASQPLEDLDSAAYLVSHLQMFCENCGTRDTPQWRKGWYSRLLGRHHLLCNACGIRYNKEQYCPLCGFIYAKDKEAKNTKDEHFLQCQNCGKWTHLECELKSSGSLPESDEWYYCVDCSHKNTIPSA